MNGSSVGSTCRTKETLLSRVFLGRLHCAFGGQGRAGGTGRDRTENMFVADSPAFEDRCGTWKWTLKD